MGVRPTPCKTICSAFRAVNATTDQSVTADIPVIPVQYPDVVFDLNNEYDDGSDPTSTTPYTFIPKQDGVYLVIASVNFIPPVVDDEIVPTNYRVLITIRVNGNRIASDNDFFGEIPIGDVTSVSAILPLKAGDHVNVAVASSTDGTILHDPIGVGFPTHFEAARFPSPDNLIFSSYGNTSSFKISPKSKF